MVNIAANEAGYRAPFTYREEDRRILYEKMKKNRKLGLLVDLIVHRESLCARFKDRKTTLPVYYELIGGPIIKRQLENLVSTFIQLEEAPLDGRRFASVFVFNPEEISFIVEQFLGWVERFKDRFVASQSETSSGLSELPEIDFAREIDRTVDLTMHFLRVNLRNNTNFEELRLKIREFFESKAKYMLE